LRNLAIVGVGWLLVLAALPPRHEYAVLDDWIYAGSVRTMLETGRFVMPDRSQAILVGQTVWGALWSALLGFSFTTLTWSTLVLSVVALFSFYGLCRVLGVRPAGALLGTALLGSNPLFLHLSYSFMTDVPCLALVLASCYCYARGVKTNRPGFLASGGIAAGWGFLIRQFAILVPSVFVLSLTSEGFRRPRLPLPEP